MNRYAISILAGVLTGITSLANSQNEPAKIDIDRLTESVYMLSSSSGGNLGVSIGADGTFMIDDKFEADGPAILKALESIGGTSPDYLANTHHHSDHTGSNQFFGEQGALIVAHRNLRKRMEAGYEVRAFSAVVEPAPKSALPSLTYGDDIHFYLNDDDLHLIHVANAHTDNDSIVHFAKANIIHTGDTFFNGFFPFIDTGAGGSLSGVIKALNLVAELADDETRIIPGHGPLATKDDVLSTVTMLGMARERLTQLQSEGASLEAAIAARPLTDIEEKWGGVMFTADQWIGVVWEGL